MEKKGTDAKHSEKNRINNKNVGKRGNWLWKESSDGRSSVSFQVNPGGKRQSTNMPAGPGLQATGRKSSSLADQKKKIEVPDVPEAQGTRRILILRTSGWPSTGRDLLHRQGKCYARRRKKRGLHWPPKSAKFSHCAEKKVRKGREKRKKGLDHYAIPKSGNDLNS